MSGSRGRHPILLVAATTGPVAVVPGEDTAALIHDVARVVPPTVLITSGVVAFTLWACAVALRRRHVRRMLADRLTWRLVPADTLDPQLDAVVRFAAQLTRSRRRGRAWLERPAATIRIRIHSTPEASVAYEMTAGAHARSVVRTALGAYPEVELHETTSAASAKTEKGTPCGSHLRVARAELVLARPAYEPLADIGLAPDPLQALAAAMQDLDDDRREQSEAIVDALPLTAWEAHRARRAMRRAAHRKHRDDRRPAPRRRPDRDPLGLADLLIRPRRNARGDLVDAADRRAVAQDLRAKTTAHEPLLHLQVLLRAESTDPARAKAHLNALVASMGQFAGRNHWRIVGTPVIGAAFLGSDGPVRRRRFDARVNTGRWQAPRRNVVGAREIAGLLKPPTARCAAPNVIRSAGHIAPPPPGLPTFTGQRDALPLGRVRERAGERLVGVPLGDTFFSYMAGRSRYGKTELGLVQFIHLARSGHGGLFLDPHADALVELKTYLTEVGVRERVVEINLAGPQARTRQPGWNPLAMHGQPPEAAEAKVEALVDAFASALGWDERNTRALALTTQAAQALIDLARKVPAECAPTLFQIPTLLGNPDWRDQVLPHVSSPTRQFFIERFPRLPAEAITAVTNLIDRLRASTPIAALLGSSTSTYDIRAAMDEGKVVLACPGSGGTRDRLVANFLVYDLLHAAKARADTPASRRRPFFVYLDEVQTYDGASSGNLAALLEQTAKYGLRAFLFNQNPERLTAATLNAVTTNRSHLLTTTVNAKAAALLAREWGGHPAADTVTRLARYTFLASVTLGGGPTQPFLVTGNPASQQHAHARHPDQVPALDAAIDQTTVRRPVRETLVALETLDERILAALTRRGQGARGAQARVADEPWEPTRP